MDPSRQARDHRAGGDDRVTWLRPDEAAVALGVTVPHVRVIAHRRKWRKAGRGREIGYWLDDVAEEAARRGQESGKTA